MLRDSPLNSCFSTLFAGPIPPELGNISTLQYLGLGDTRLSGETLMGYVLIVSPGAMSAWMSTVRKFQMQAEHA